MDGRTNGGTNRRTSERREQRREHRGEREGRGDLQCTERGEGGVGQRVPPLRHVIRHDVVALTPEPTASHSADQNGDVGRNGGEGVSETPTAL